MKRLALHAPGALEYFAALVADDNEFALFEAAITLAQDEHPSLDTQGVLQQLDTLAARLKNRMPADASPLQRLRALNHFFFRELMAGVTVAPGGDFRIVGELHANPRLRDFLA